MKWINWEVEFHESPNARRQRPDSITCFIIVVRFNETNANKMKSEKFLSHVPSVGFYVSKLLLHPLKYIRNSVCIITYHKFRKLIAPQRSEKRTKLASLFKINGYLIINYRTKHHSDWACVWITIKWQEISLWIQVYEWFLS